MTAGRATFAVASHRKHYIAPTFRTQCAGGGGLEKVPILKQLLHFSGQSDGGEW